MKKESAVYCHLAVRNWEHCGFSAKFLAAKEDKTNDASEFETECYALAETYIKQSLKLGDFDEE